MRFDNGARPARAHASFWRHLAAIAYDALALFALFMLLTGLALAARRGHAFDSQSIWFRILLLTGCWTYFAWSWTHGGVTLGMRAWRLVLVRRDGGPVGLGAATVRFFAAWLSALAAGLGFFWRLIDRDRLTWHDCLSGTRLLQCAQLSEPDDGKSRHGQQQDTRRPGGDHGIE